MTSPILIVDHEPDIREALREILEDAGYVVEVAENTPTALEVLERVLPRFVLVDIHPPVVDGAEVIRRMRANERWSRIPIAVATYDPSLAPSGVAVLRRPFDLPVLLEAIARTAGSDR